MRTRAPATTRRADLPGACNRARRQSGLSHVEVLLATLLVALSLVPALEALQSATLGSAVHESLAVQQRQLTSKMEEVLAQPFIDLEIAEAATGGDSYSDAPGSPDRRLVFLSRWDIDNADADDNPLTGPDDGILWVRVVIEATPHIVWTLTAR